MPTKNRWCRLCNAAFVPEIKEQQYCNACLSFVEIDDNKLQFKEIKIKPITNATK